MYKNMHKLQIFDVFSSHIYFLYKSILDVQASGNFF